MKQIRKGVFETNSSSIHAISINIDADIILPKFILFSFGEYGWQFETYRSMSSRADYLWTGINGFYEEKEVEEIKNKIISWLKEDNIEYKFDDEINTFWEQGYVDHCEDLKNFLNWVLENKENFYQYLFAKGNVIETGNDNGDFDRPQLALEFDHDDNYKVFWK